MKNVRTLIMLQKLPWLLWDFGLVNMSRPLYLGTELEALANKTGKAKQKQSGPTRVDLCLIKKENSC